MYTKLLINRYNRCSLNVCLLVFFVFFLKFFWRAFCCKFFLKQITLAENLQLLLHFEFSCFK